MSEPVAALFRVDDHVLKAHPHVYGPDPATRCIGLANALASSPAWTRLRRGASLVVRPDTGLVGVLGTVAAEDRVLVNGLGWQVADLLRRLRPVPYDEVERAILDLADIIRGQLSQRDLRRSRLVAVPRGGLIVAGMLAYALGIPRAHVGSVPDSESLTILVDDCAISGTRLREVLSESRAPEIVVAQLHAHPDLCRRVENLEETVRACLAARDLQDHAPRRHDYPEWKQRWAARSPSDYWTGDPDHVCYPWNEPDALLWNPETDRGEAGWRVVPPSWCLKNRADWHEADLQHCVAADGRLRPRKDVAWAVAADGVFLAALGHPKAVVVRDSAATMWQAIIATGDVGEAALAVADSYGIDVSKARGDLDRFVGALARRGFIQAE